MTAQPAAPTSEWLQEQLQTLMNSPYIHFNHPPGVRLGHGPVDLFSTRFANLVAAGATGTVAGEAVDRAGLKQALLALQRKWNNDSATFTPQAGLQAGEVGTRAEWTPTDADQPAVVNATATTVEEGGTNRIDTLALDGDSGLFSSDQQ